MNLIIIYNINFFQITQCNFVTGISIIWTICFGDNGRSNACHITR